MVRDVAGTQVPFPPDDQEDPGSTPSQQMTRAKEKVGSVLAVALSYLEIPKELRDTNPRIPFAVRDVWASLDATADTFRKQLWRPEPLSREPAEDEEEFDSDQSVEGVDEY